MLPVSENLALIKVQFSSASVDIIYDELHPVDDVFPCKVRELSPTEFLVAFPSMESSIH